MTDDYLYCGDPCPNPAYPYRCTKPRGHDGKHGYAGVFWSLDEHTARPAHPDTMIGRK